MDKEEMKKKFESGNYVCMYKQSTCDIYIRLDSPMFHDETKKGDYKLIHKKHEEVLNAWLLDNNSIIIKTASHLGSCLEFDFIGTYDEEFNYSLDEALLFTKEIDLENCYCEATEENYNRLIKDGLIKSDYDFGGYGKGYILINEHGKEFMFWGLTPIESKKSKQIHLVNNKWEYK